MDVVLVPVTEEWLPALEAWRDDPAQRSPYDDFGDRPAGGLGRAYRETGLPSALLVLVGGSGGGSDRELAGMVSWHPAPNGPNPQSLALNIGVSLRPEHRGRGVGTAAHRLLVDHLFATTDVHRLEAGADVTNGPERAVLARTGFSLDGVLRGAQFRQGSYHDMAMYSLLRTDPRT